LRDWKHKQPFIIMTNQNLTSLIQLNNIGNATAVITQKAAAISADPVALTQAQAAVAVIQNNLSALAQALTTPAQTTTPVTPAA
jgi:hypothetical protein